MRRLYVVEAVTATSCTSRRSPRSCSAVCSKNTTTTTAIGGVVATIDGTMTAAAMTAATIAATTGTTTAGVTTAATIADATIGRPMIGGVMTTVATEDARALLSVARRLPHGTLRKAAAKAAEAVAEEAITAIAVTGIAATATAAKARRSDVQRSRSGILPEIRSPLSRR